MREACSAPGLRYLAGEHLQLPLLLSPKLWDPHQAYAEQTSQSSKFLLPLWVALSYLFRAYVAQATYASSPLPHLPRMLQTSLRAYSMQKPLTRELMVLWYLMLPTAPQAYAMMKSECRARAAQASSFLWRH